MLAGLIILATLAGWEALVRAGMVDELLLPAPSDIAASLWNDGDILGPDLAVTLQEVLVGLLAAVVVGAALGIGMHLSGVVRGALRPLLIGPPARPPPGVAPPALLL